MWSYLLCRLKMKKTSIFFCYNTSLCEHVTLSNCVDHVPPIDVISRTGGWGEWRAQWGLSGGIVGCISRFSFYKFTNWGQLQCVNREGDMREIYQMLHAYCIVWRGFKARYSKENDYQLNRLTNGVHWRYWKLLYAADMAMKRIYYHPHAPLSSLPIAFYTSSI